MKSIPPNPLHHPPAVLRRSGEAEDLQVGLGSDHAAPELTSEYNDLGGTAVKVTYVPGMETRNSEKARDRTLERLSAATPGTGIRSVINMVATRGRATA
jgi:hypothetical protein